jgi:hypothetical protein
MQLLSFDEIKEMCDNSDVIYVEPKNITLHHSTFVNDASKQTLEHFEETQSFYPETFVLPEIGDFYKDFNYIKSFTFNHDDRSPYANLHMPLTTIELLCKLSRPIKLFVLDFTGKCGNVNALANIYKEYIDGVLVINAGDNNEIHLFNNCIDSFITRKPVKNSISTSEFNLKQYSDLVKEFYSDVLKRELIKRTDKN